MPTDRRLRTPLKESPAFVLMQAGRLASEWTAEALQTLELTTAQFATLALITRVGPLTQGSVGEQLGVSKPVMSRIASRLVAAGLAERRLDFYDARHRRLCPTQAGAELVAEASDEVATVDAQFLERIGEDSLTALAELPPPTLTAMERALVNLGWY
jgi:DNA-binding MarR family transcriptional regulator